MRTVTSSYRIRAYPNGAQRRLLDCWSGAARWLWNATLDIRSAAYRECHLTLTGNDLSRWLTQWKRTTGHEWLAEVPATALTQCLRDQDHAFRNFFVHRAGYPRYKPKALSGSLRFQKVSAAWAEGIVSLPKLGTLRLAESLPRVKRPDMVTLSRDAAGAYYVSFCTQAERDLLPVRQRSVGVDLGIAHLATLSNGEKIPNPKHFHSRLRYLRQQQRCLARRQKGSRRREKQRLRVARAHARVRQARHAAVHALTSRLIYEFMSWGAKVGALALLAGLAPAAARAADCHCKLLLGVGATYQFWGWSDGMVVPVTLELADSRWEVGAYWFARKQIAVGYGPPDKTAADPYWGFTAMRRWQFLHRPWGRLYFGFGAAYRSETDYLEPTRWNFAYLVAARFDLGHPGSVLEIGVRHWSDFWIKNPNRGQDFFTVSVGF